MKNNEGVLWIPSLEVFIDVSVIYLPLNYALLHTPHPFWTGAEKSVLLMFLPHLHYLSLIGMKGDSFFYDIKAETFIQVMELLDMQWMNKSVIQALRTRMHQ